MRELFIRVIFCRDFDGFDMTVLLTPLDGKSATNHIKQFDLCKLFVWLILAISRRQGFILHVYSFKTFFYNIFFACYTGLTSLVSGLYLTFFTIFHFFRDLVFATFCHLTYCHFLFHFRIHYPYFSSRDSSSSSSRNLFVEKIVRKKF